MTRSGDMLERVSRLVTLIALGLAVLGVVVAPMLALSWANRPFPGFLLDHTLVVTDQNGEGWSGRAAGVSFGQRITRFGGNAIESDRQYQEVLNSLAAGDVVAISTQVREGGERYYPSVQLNRFEMRDLSRLFWMPYLMGLAYLSIGAWIYRARGSSRPGRALAFFCFATAVAMSLYFDVFSTHVGTPVWAVAIACLGGALLSLAMRFPQEAVIVRRYPSMLTVPYLVSFGLGAWAAASLYDQARPWEYLVARDVSYRYAGIGGLLFLGTMLFRAMRSTEAVVRRQARIVLLGSAIAFAPLLVWLLTPVAGIRLHFEPVLYMPSLVIFPLAVAVAIFRYRLLQMDAIFNRTILWGALTAILAGVISVSITLLQKIFQSITGERSDIAVVLTSLILVSVFTPVKTWLQTVLDRTLKDSPDHIRDLRDFGGAINSYVQMSDAQLMTRKLLDKAASGMSATSGAINLVRDGRMETAYTYGEWRGEAWVASPLEYGGQRFGLLLLGPREGARPYTREEFAVLQESVDAVAHALAVGKKRTNGAP